MSLAEEEKERTMSRLTKVELERELAVMKRRNQELQAQFAEQCLARKIEKEMIVDLEGLRHAADVLRRSAEKTHHDAEIRAEAYRSTLNDVIDKLIVGLTGATH